MAQRRHRILRAPAAAGRSQPLGQLMIIVLSIYLAALGCWLGGIVFFSFFTAPAVFTVLPRPEAGQLISTTFPRSYMLGYIVGTISLVLAIYFTAVQVPRMWWGLTTLALAIGLGITFYA